jgi:SET domain-containing protein
MASRSYRISRSVTGLGLFATKCIKRGAYIATYRGRRITTEESNRREARGARYMFALNKRWVIDGSPRWNVARYINHSCRPNAKPVGRGGRIVIIALRRIAPDEEITYDYGRDYLKSFLRDGGCRCAACRRKKALQRRRTHRLTKLIAGN